APSRASRRSPCSTASRARSIVRAWRTSSSFSSSTPGGAPGCSVGGEAIGRCALPIGRPGAGYGLRAEELLQPVQPPLKLLAAGRERQPHETLRAEGRARHHLDLRAPPAGSTEARRL